MWHGCWSLRKRCSRWKFKDTLATAVTTDVCVCMAESAVRKRTMKSGIIGELGWGVVDRRLLMSKRNRIVASIEPWRRSAFTGNGWDGTQSTRTKMVRLLRKLDVHDVSDKENPAVGSSDRRSCQARSKALKVSSEVSCVSTRLKPTKSVS